MTQAAWQSVKFMNQFKMARSHDYGTWCTHIIVTKQINILITFRSQDKTQFYYCFPLLFYYFLGRKKMRWIMFLWAVWNMHVCISVTFGDISSTFSSKCQCWSLLYSQHQNGCEMDNEVNINFWMIFHLVIHLTN